MRRYIVFILATILVLVFSVAAQQRSDSNPSGRPGTFRFIPNAQAEREAAELQSAYESLIRLNGAIATISDEKLRQQMQDEINIISSFLMNAEQRRTRSAGITAAGVERRLNSMKGTHQCGACHESGEAMPSASIPTNH